MIFNAYDWIPIVSLPERHDRRRALRRQLFDLGVGDDPRVEFFDAIRCADPGPFLRIGSHGAFLSHLEILRQAASRQTRVLILQDDCAFRPGARTYRVPDDCDIFYGGWETASDEHNLADSDIVGAHCMGFSPRSAMLAARYLEAFLSDPEFEADPMARAKRDYNPAIRPPIDGALVWFRRAHPELVTVFADLAYQRSSRTDIGNRRWFDRVPLLRTLAGAARTVMAGER